MTLIVSNEQVAQLLSIKDVIHSLEGGYREASAGKAILGSRADLNTITSHPDSVYQLKSMSSVVPSLGVGAVRINSDILSYPTIEGKVRRQKVPLAPGNRWTGLVLLFSTETGEPLMIFPDGVMQRLRVAGTSALGAKYMARSDAKTVALIGSGWQAGAQAIAIAAIRNIRNFRVYSMNPQNCKVFCETMSPEIEIDMEPFENVSDAVANSDIVLCATNSNENVLLNDHVEPGMHISSIRDNEIALEAIRNANVTAMHDTKSMDFENYDSTHGLVTKDQEKEAGNDPRMNYLRSVPTLPDLITKKACGRVSNDQVTCFLNYRGLALQFAVCGALLYKQAKERNIGNALPTEWFTEDVVP